jgi:sodium-dependent dicarboxylate transporter 2/3/5
MQDRTGRGLSSSDVGWRDSRAAVRSILAGPRVRLVVRFILLAAVSVAALAVWRTLAGDLPVEERAVLLLLLLAVGLWTSEAIPAFAVGLFIMGYLVFALGTGFILDEPRDVAPYVNTWSSQVIWIMLGGFVLADGMSRTGLDRALLIRAIRPAGTRPDRVLLAIMLAAAIASMFISNTSTTVLLTGAVLPLVRRLGPADPFGRSLLVAIPLAASVGGMGTIIGSSPNAIAVGMAAEFATTIDFVEWMIVGVPPALVLVGIAWHFLCRRYPASSASVSLDFAADTDVDLPEPRERFIVSSTAVATVALWITSPLHGIHAAAISLIPIVVFSMTQVLDANRVRSLPWDTLMLIAGGLSLGEAVVDSGLAARMATGLSFLAQFDSPLPGLVVLALVTVAVSNFMSNTATVALILPIAVSILPGHEIAVCLTLGLSASCALLLPVSTPPNAIAHATGMVRTRDFRPGGLLIGLLGPAIIIAWVAVIARLIG